MANVGASEAASDPSAPVDGSRGPRDDRYQVVARRYRPKSFDKLIGQQHVGQALSNAINTGRVGHAYLFTGARGVGKTSAARIFAKALNAPGGPTADPDSDSDVAQAIDVGEDVDVLEIDGASNRGIDEIRALRAAAGIRPSRSRFKIYIIDEVHMLTKEAFNALLKTLEEPPPHVKFIFCTTDPEKIPITVLSRCQRFDFSPVQTESILGRLREIVDLEQIPAEDAALRLIARRAEGSMRDSQSLLEQVISFGSGGLTTATVHSLLGTADDSQLHALAEALAGRQATEVLSLIDQACQSGSTAGQLAEQLLGYFRDVLIVTVGCPAEMQRYAGESLHDDLQRLGRQWGLQTVLAIVGILDQTLVRIRESLHGRVLLESALVQVCHLPDLQAVADLAASFAGPNQPASGSGAASGQRDSSAAQKKKSEPLAVTAASSRPATPAATATAPISPAATTAAPAIPATTAPAASANRATAPAAPADREIPAATAAKFVGQPTATRDGGNPGPAVAAKSRAQVMREVEQNRYVQDCLELFGAEIVKVDPPR